MKSKAKVSILLALVIIFLFSSIFYSRFSKNIIAHNNYLEFNEKDQGQIKQSGFWNLTGSPIYIDGSATGVGAHNWTWAETQPWCSGSGSWTDPYVIEDITIDGQGSGNCIEIRNSDAYFIIQNCSLYNSGFSDSSGIKLDNVNNGKIIENNCSDNNRIGIFLWYSDNNTLSGNTASNNNDYGIYLIYSDNNKLSENIANNTYDGIALRNSDDNTLSGNTVNNNYYGIHLFDSDSNTLSGNNANNGGGGIYIRKSNCNTLSGNTASNNAGGGIFLIECNSSTLSGNIANTNGIYGIDVFYSNNNTLSGNTVNKNSYGILLDTGNNNVIYKNTFINNGANAEDNGIDNHWDNGTVGNYWDNYRGVDANDDGIGDTPYIIQGTAGSQDNYPIWTDSDDRAPVISIIFPLPESPFTLDTPDYNISIDELNLDTIWYTLDGGGTNYTITDLTGTFNQTAWDALSEGSVTIWFYANDTAGNVGSAAVTINKDTIPVITIILPLSDITFGLVAPNYNISIDELNLDTIWYTLDGGGTNYTITDLTGTFNQTAWDTLSEGSVTIRFYANDTAGNIGSAVVTVEKDTSAPIISIIFPLPNGVFSLDAPNYQITINELNLDTVWYSLDGGITNYTNVGLSDTFDQLAWGALSESNVTIWFYSNDTAGNIGSVVVSVEKDISAPVISIILPLLDGVFGLGAPIYNISIDDLNLDTIWYTLDGGGTNYTITSFTGTIIQTAWEALGEGSVTIRFCANDTVGNIGFIEIEVIIEIPEDQPIISFGNYYILFTTIAILSFIILEKQKKK